MAGGDSARKPLTLDLSTTPPPPIHTYTTQPTGLPHVTPGLTGQHVLSVDSFNREQVFNEYSLCPNIWFPHSL